VRILYSARLPPRQNKAVRISSDMFRIFLLQGNETRSRQEDWHPVLNPQKLKNEQQVQWEFLKLI
jgi:hypothetical protein